MGESTYLMKSGANVSLSNLRILVLTREMQFFVFSSGSFRSSISVSVSFRFTSSFVSTGLRMLPMPRIVIIA